MITTTTTRLLFRCLINISKMLHVKCRNTSYPGNEGVDRAPVPDEKIPWSVSWKDYQPVSFTSQRVLGQVWADPEEFVNLKWNKLDGNVNRVSFTGVYDVVNGIPRNPCGRTGITGRGLLGRWGPNHAADPIVTRWRRKNGVAFINTSGKRELEFVAIQRRDCKQWAIPGGMVDPGETISQTLLREFQEEAINGLNSKLDGFFKEGVEIYKGYVDDPRNTDNAWMETVAVNFHDDDDSVLAEVTLEAGDDARNVRWEVVGSGLNLYASHRDFLKLVAEKHNAHW